MCNIHVCDVKTKVTSVSGFPRSVKDKNHVRTRRKKCKCLTEDKRKDEKENEGG